MIFRDLVKISSGNLWRLKLRTTLTVAGIVISIAAFVSMVSFGAGTKENVDRQFRELGLLTTIQVYPKNKSKEDQGRDPKLDDASLARISRIPGVLLVYPYDPLSIKVRLADTLIDSRAQSLSLSAMQTKLFSKMRAGKIFQNDSSREAIVSTGLLTSARNLPPDSAIGRQLVASVQVSVIDSAFGHLFVDGGESVFDRVRRLSLDSLLHSAPYRRRIIRTEANEAVRRLVDGFLNARRTVSDTLTVCGVVEKEGPGRVRMEPVIIPVRTARRFSTGGFSGNPADLFAAMSSGNLFPSSPDDPAGKFFSEVTVTFDPNVLYSPINDSIEAMGYRTFSFAEQFEEIQKGFVYLNMALGAVGLLALLTASLGIVNTMVMSILERKKQIGIFKSLGADESEIRMLFLVESGVIGLIGAVVGIFSGWVITRIITAVAHIYMRRENIPEVELFSLPPWLIAAALAVGTGVALLAGFYPAARAARVDPVEALRSD